MMAAAMAAELSAFRGAILSFKDDPGVTSSADSHVHFEDGLLVVEDGHVARVGPAEALLATLPKGTPVTDHRGRLLMPGFVDAHVHYAQTDVIASGGGSLLGWLEREGYSVNVYSGAHLPVMKEIVDAQAGVRRCEFLQDVFDDG